MIKSTTHNAIAKARTLYNGAMSRSKKNELEFDLDLNWVVNNMNNLKCQFTGMPLTLNVSYVSGYNSVKHNSASIHKIEPSLGYVKSNCVIIAASVNMFISNHDIKDVLYVSDSISKNKETILINYKLNKKSCQKQ
jgi:hypothetical protein